MTLFVDMDSLSLEGWLQAPVDLLSGLAYLRSVRIIVILGMDAHSDRHRRLQELCGPSIASTLSGTKPSIGLTPI